VNYNFDWDPIKARQNQKKHGVRFERASEIFLDPHALSIYDEDHSADEDRWITLGRDRAGKFLVAIHTFSEKSEDVCTIRMISARKAARKEIKQYEGDKP
jgi:uncharacterized DUF497 family protein